MKRTSERTAGPFRQVEFLKRVKLGWRDELVGMCIVFKGVSDAS
jgi:hypothetical protein